MKKYTQRELLSEAFRDSLKRALTSDTAKGIGSVALAGLKGAAKFITPSGVQLAKQLASPFTKSTEIFKSQQSQNAIKDLGPRFDKDLNFHLPIAKIFNDIAKDSLFFKRFLNIVDKWVIENEE